MADAERPPCPLWAKLIATGGGVGYIPFAPGTFASFAAILFLLAINYCYLVVGLFFERFEFVEDSSPTGWLFYFFVHHFPGTNSLILAILLLLVGVTASRQFADVIKIKDPRQVVIDEYVGQLITISGLWMIWPRLEHYLSAFIIFRILDIWKPWPIRWFEKLPGGWGIMMDDVVAGVFGAIILATLVHFHWLPGMR